LYVTDIFFIFYLHSILYKFIKKDNLFCVSLSIPIYKCAILFLSGFLSFNDTLNDSTTIEKVFVILQKNYKQI